MYLFVWAGDMDRQLWAFGVRRGMKRGMEKQGGFFDTEENEKKSSWPVHLLFNGGIKFLSLYSLSPKNPRGGRKKKREKKLSKKINKERRKERNRHVINSHVMQAIPQTDTNNCCEAGSKRRTAYTPEKTLGVFNIKTFCMYECIFSA